MNQTRSLQRQRIILQKIKVYTEQARKPIYLEVLQCPLNYKHFTELNRNLKIFVDHSIQKQVSEIVSAIANLYPDLNIQWLPGIVYPFIKIFKKDSLAQFEISVTYLANWCSAWFTDYPAPSMKIISFMATYLRTLQKKVNDIGSSLGALLWPMFVVNFTDVLNKQDWLQFCDFIILRPQSPWLPITIMILLVKSLEAQLIKCRKLQQMHSVLRKQRKISIQNLLKDGDKLSSDAFEPLSEIFQHRIYPLTKFRYPLLKFLNKELHQGNNFPKVNSNSDLRKLDQEIMEAQNLLANKEQEILGSNNANCNKYSEKLQTALRNQIKVISETHDKKLAGLKQVEQSLKQCIAKNQQFREKESSTLAQFTHKRSVLQKALSQIKKQANSMKALEIHTLDRLRTTIRIKQQEQKSLYQKLHREIHK